jgi:hypothetical protein
MKVRFSPVLLLTLGLAWTALAQTPSQMRAGNWEVAVKMNLPGMEAAPPMKQTQCITAAMLKDPTSAIPKGPGGGDCKMTDYKLAASTATYTMTCTQPVPMNATGEIKYSGTDAYTGTLTLDMGGQSMVLSYDAKRIGDCGQ